MRVGEQTRTPPARFAGASPGSVLCARLEPPTFGRNLIARERVINRIDAAPGERAVPVVVVAAAAGAGKSAALTQWADGARARGRRIAWLTLLESDNSARSLRSAVAESLALYSPAALARDLRALPAREDDPAAFVGELDRLLSAAPQLPVTDLVLDDVQQLHDADALALLDTLAQWTPSELRLVISARYAPPIALHRLRLTGRLVEVTPEDLTLDRDEAVAFLAQHGLRLSDDQLELVMTRTEGWAAGVRMAGIALEGEPDVSARLAEFSGNDHAVADYLVAEVLRTLPPRVREFMLATTIVDYFTAEFAQAMTGSDDAAQILDALVQQNRLLVRHGSTAPHYRYHPLLRSYFVAELSRAPEELRYRIHRRAMDWCVAHDEPLHALEHAVHAGLDRDDLAGPLLRHGLAAVLKGDGAATSALLSLLPPDSPGQPAVELVRAAAAFEMGDPIAVEAALVSVRALPDTALSDEEARVLRALGLRHWSWTGAPAAPAPGGPLATDDIPGDLLDFAEHESGVLSASLLATAGWTEAMYGRVDRARTALRRAAALAAAASLHAVRLRADAALATIELGRGSLETAAEISTRAGEFAREHRLSGSAPATLARLVDEIIDYHRGRGPSGAAAPVTGDALAQGLPLPVAGFGATFAALRDGTAADAGHEQLARLHNAAMTTEWTRLPQGCAALLLPSVAVRILRSGEVEWAREIGTLIDAVLPDTAESALAHAILAPYRGRAESPRRHLRPILDDELPVITPRTRIDALLAFAVAAEAADAEADAHRYLCAAIELVEHDGLFRPFLDAAPAVTGLLTRSRGRLGHREGLAGELLGLLGPAGGPSVALTGRELELLVELPSMRTTDEIAASLFVSVNTVKTHLRSIYRKLGVRSRREAVAAARDSGLL